MKFHDTVNTTADAAPMLAHNIGEMPTGAPITFTTYEAQLTFIAHPIKLTITNFKNSPFLVSPDDLKVQCLFKI